MRNVVPRRTEQLFLKTEKNPAGPPAGGGKEERGSIRGEEEAAPVKWMCGFVRNVGIVRVWPVHF